MQLLALALIGGFIAEKIRQARRSQRARGALSCRMGVEITQSVSVGPDAEHEIRRPKLKPTQHPDAKALIPTSVLLQRLHDEAPPDHFTLGWLMGRLHKRSFGLIMLLLAVVAIAPGVSIVAGLLS